MVYILVEVFFCCYMFKDAQRLSPSTEPPSFHAPGMECSSRKSSFVLSVCVPFCLCVSICLLPKNPFNLDHISLEP